MIKVNGQEHPWRPGMTVRDVLRERNYVFPMIIVRIDGRFVHHDHYDSTPVSDGADFWAIHLISGG